MNIKDIEILPMEVKLNIFQFLGAHPTAAILKDIVETVEELKNKWNYDTCLTYIRRQKENRIVERIWKERDLINRQRHYLVYIHYSQYV